MSIDWNLIIWVFKIIFQLQFVRQNQFPIWCNTEVFYFFYHIRTLLRITIGRNQETKVFHIPFIYNQFIAFINSCYLFCFFHR